MIKTEEYFALNRPIELIFEGSTAAELFTREIKESMRAVLEKSFVAEGENRGFLNSSTDGRPWDGTMWSRDVGTFLRELVHYGYYGHASLIAEYLIRRCGKNKDGYYTFPEYQVPGEIKSGSELDGTCAILIAFAIYVKKLRGGGSAVIQSVCTQIKEFLNCESSPLRYIIKESREKGLIAGMGEFGGGMGVEGEWCNVVQNHLAADALCICADIVEEALAADARTAAADILKNIEEHMIDENGFIWCVKPGTLLPSDDCLKANANVGFTGINGCAAMKCDIGKNKITDSYWKRIGNKAAKKTFYRLLEAEGRREQYEKYGMYLQFDTYCEGMLTSPSYGQGYAIQLAINLNMPEEAGRLFEYLAAATYNPPKEYKLTRDSSCWFYERFLSPDYFKLPKERQTVEEGCGALNIVNVAEPLKIARQIAGLEAPENTGTEFKIRGIDKITIKR